MRQLSHSEGSSDPPQESAGENGREAMLFVMKGVDP